MFPGPVFTHELRMVSRRPRFYVIRSLCGLLLLYFFVTISWRWDGPRRALTLDEISEIGTGLFKLTLVIQGFTAIFLTPALVAGTIAEDRQRKILHYLLASPLSNGEIVLGKLLVRLLYLVILVLVGFPIMSLSLLLGGVDPVVLVLAEAGIISVVFFLGSLSIFLSSRLHRPRGAIVVAYACVFAWLMLPAADAMITSELVPIWPTVIGPVERFLSLLAAATPLATIFAYLAPFQSPFPTSGWLWMIGLNSLLGIGLLTPTILGLRRREQAEGKGRRGRIFGAGDRGRAWLRGRPFSLDTPMIWKECPGRYRFRDPALRVLVALLKLVVAGLLAAWMLTYAWLAFIEVLQYGYGVDKDWWDARDGFNVGVRFATVCGYVLLILILAGGSAGAITSEKEKDSWISLISTPLEGKEILRGKIAGSFWSARYVFAGLVVLWLTGLIAGSLHPFGFVLLTLATAVYSAFAVVLGIHYSSICRTTTRSLVATFATLLMLNGGYMMCCIPIFANMGPGPEFPIIISVSGVTVFVESSAACSYKDVERFLRPSHGSYGGEMRPAMVFTYILSLGGYGLATFLLYQNRVEQFDHDAERPRRRVDDFHRHQKSSRTEPDPSGIKFLGDQDADSAITPEGAEEPPGDSGECRAPA